MRFLAIDTGRECNQKIPTSCSAQVQIETGVSKGTPEVAKTPILSIFPNPEPKVHSFSGPPTFPSRHLNSPYYSSRICPRSF